jgi:hypothetical protein
LIFQYTLIDKSTFSLKLFVTNSFLKRHGNMAISRYIEFHLIDGLGNTATQKMRIAGADMTTGLPTPVQATELATALYGANKLAYIGIQGYSIVHFDDSLLVPVVANMSLASSYWKVLVDQGADDFTFRIPGARNDPLLRQGQKTTYANTGAVAWQDVITLLQAAPWDISNPDPAIAPNAGALISGAQFKDTGKKAPRENIGATNP